MSKELTQAHANYFLWAAMLLEGSMAHHSQKQIKSFVRHQWEGASDLWKERFQIDCPEDYERIQRLLS